MTGAEGLFDHPCHVAEEVTDGLGLRGSVSTVSTEVRYGALGLPMS